MEKGFDSFDAQLSAARSPLFGEWAALAGVASNGSTTPVTPGTGGGFSGGDDDDDDAEDDDDQDNEDDD